MPGIGIGGGTRVVTMSQTQSSRPGRGAPAASTATRGVILVVGAVIIGVMLLWKGGGADTASGNGEDVLQPDTGSSATAGKGSTTTVAPPVTAVPPAQLAVSVANASGVTGLAKAKAEELKAKGMRMRPSCRRQRRRRCRRSSSSRVRRAMPKQWRPRWIPAGPCRSHS